MAVTEGIAISFTHTPIDCQSQVRGQGNRHKQLTIRDRHFGPWVNNTTP